MSQPQPWGHHGQRLAPPAITSAADLRAATADVTVAEYPAADRPFVTAVVLGIILQTIGLPLTGAGIALRLTGTAELATIALAAGGALALAGTISLLVGLYRMLNAIQVTYLLARRLP